MTDNTRILLASRPNGEPTHDNFRLETSPIPSPGDGEVLLRTIYLSLDPYMRGRMNDAESYAAPQELGEVMQGGTVAEVIESNDQSLSVGDLVLSYHGWQSYAVLPAKHVRRLDPASAPISTAVGVLGMPGFTAYAGLLQIGKPQPGETVVVAAAAGPVGSAVGQIAKIYAAVGWDAATLKYTGKTEPVKWVKVHNLPDHAYFNHAQHVAVGKIECQECHGPIDEKMDVAEQWAPLTMGWCIKCHAEKDVKI